MHSGLRPGLNQVNGDVLSGDPPFVLQFKESLTDSKGGEQQDPPIFSPCFYERCAKEMTKAFLKVLIDPIELRASISPIGDKDFEAKSGHFSKRFEKRDENYMRNVWSGNHIISRMW